MTLTYKARDRYPIDPTEPTMVCDITNLRYNYSKWRRFGTTSTKNPDFSCLQPKHVTGISSTPGNPHKPRLGLRSPSSNARQLFCGKKPELTKTKKEKIFNRQWELMFNAGNFPVFSFFGRNCGDKNKNVSPAGNRTPVSRVTGGDTHHYTTEDCERKAKCSNSEWVATLCQKKSWLCFW